MSAIATGFGNITHDSQYCFRQILTAMSQPGTIIDLHLMQGFGGMTPAASQVLLALADNSTPVWLSKKLVKDKTINENLTFHLGCAILSDHPDEQRGESPQTQANFAVIAEQDMLNFDWETSDFNPGNEEYPDTSTTVIIEVNDLMTSNIQSQSGSNLKLKLTGPGIENENQVTLQSIAADAIQSMLSQRKIEHFPLGLDYLFVCDDKAIALPRTTTVEIISCM